MKTASADLIALLASVDRQYWVADLYLFELIGGGTLRYCSGDRDITYAGETWSAGGTTGMYFERKGNRSKVSQKLGVSIDTLVFDVMPGSGQVLGNAFLSAIGIGLFDGADMTLYRAVMPTYGDVSDGAVIWFAGRVAEIDMNRSYATFNINSHLELLNQNMPRNLFQSGCVNTLFDASCALDPDDFVVAGTCSSGSSTYLINATLAQATGYFDQGKLIFTSGNNNGFFRGIRTYTIGSPGTILLNSPLPFAPANGDTFNIYPGCDKLRATCSAKFANLANFRGMPYIPIVETAI